jgi:hypothetical protein
MPKRALPNAPPGKLPAPIAPTPHLSNIILRKVSCSTTEEDHPEKNPIIPNRFVFGCRRFIARIYCNEECLY